MERSEQILHAVELLREAIRTLDNAQVGDWRGQISPIKHQLMDAINPLVDPITAVAYQAYQDEGSDQAKRLIASMQLDDDYRATQYQADKLEEHLKMGDAVFPEHPLGAEVKEALQKLLPKCTYPAGEDHPASFRSCIYCGLIEEASADFHKPDCPVMVLRLVLRNANHE